VDVTLWGCRGSLAVPGPETVRHGGTTSCLEVVLSDGTLLVLDAGTGIRPLGLRLTQHEGPLHLLLTHLHLDHLEGLAFFMPIWEPDREVHIWGPRSSLETLEARVARYFSPPLFPIDIHDVPARLSFHDAPEEPWRIGGAAIEAHPVTHPGPTLGYRITGDGATLAYVPDHEPQLGGDLHTLPPEWISGFAVADGADVLLHDSQYFEDEYDTKVGWGHSTVAAAVAFARAAGVGRLVLFHHDPLHTHADLVTLQARAAELWGPDGVPPELAVEGTTMTLTGRVAAAG
jgi:ribonuclease BN (tRNA processing enzyme)